MLCSSLPNCNCTPLSHTSLRPLSLYLSPLYSRSSFLSPKFFHCAFRILLHGLQIAITLNFFSEHCLYLPTLTKPSLSTEESTSANEDSCLFLLNLDSLRSMILLPQCCCINISLQIIPALTFLSSNYARQPFLLSSITPSCIKKLDCCFPFFPHDPG